MSFLGWLTVAGVLLLVMALSSAVLRRLPVSTSLVYLGCGLVAGPLGFGWLHLNLIEHAPWMERLSEVAVIVSLFVGGLKLRLSLSDPAWRAAYMLAGPVMILCIAGVAFAANLIFGLDPWLALLIGAVLAPTDPVLAGSVTVSKAGDDDRLRYALSGEAGLNDGAAFPFVVFGLLWMTHGSMGDWVGQWALIKLLWAVPAGLLTGYLLGRLGGRLTIFLRGRHRDVESPNDFMALALIALSYAATEWIGAWGFLAAFAAGVGMRSAERRVVRTSPHPEHAARPEEGKGAHPPAETLVGRVVDSKEMSEPAVAAGVVLHDATTFGDTVDRLLEVLLVLAVGVALGTHWDSRAIVLGVLLLFVIRPLAAHLFLAGTPTSPPQRWFIGWLGIRGIGSIYYLTYSLSHGLTGGAAETAVTLTLSVVAISILLHGATAQPLLNRYENSLRSRIT
ncbi:MAG TPA: sodium:proton antiporter [Thermoanaerobaculia bacterium]|nr:sodium:proton antiporter [Thermoanaerobaculia bacterium]